MKNGKKIEDIILEELRQIQADVKQIRQTDIPAINTTIAIVKVNSSNTAKIITGIGGAITLVVSMAAAHWMK